MGLQTQQIDVKDQKLFEYVLTWYLRNLQKNPILTKSITSGVVAGLGDAIGQYIIMKSKSSSDSATPGPVAAKEFKLRGIASFAAFGALISAPLTHNYYMLLDRAVPVTSSNAALKRLLIDRGIFAPILIFIYFYVMQRVEGGSHEDAVKKIKQSFWPAVLMNWKFWTIIQYVNLNYVPMQYRILVGNGVGLLWSIYLATKRH